jgi:branched-chain amino acid transport system substrate-binding protein
MIKKRIQALAILSGAAIAAASFVAVPSSSAASTPIKIGYLNATIGPFAGPAPDGTRGVNMAIKEFGGAINGRKIVLIEEATDATAATAVTKAKKLVEKDKVDIVFGPLSGDEGVAIANYAKTVPTVTFVNSSSSASEATLTVKAPNFFRFHGDAAQWNGGLGEEAVKMGYKKIASLADDYSFPYANFGGFAAGFCKAGGTIVKAQWPALGTKDYSSVVAGIPAGIDAIYAGVGGSDAVNFLTTATQNGVKKPLIGGTILVDASVLAAKADIQDAAKGTIAAGPVPPADYHSAEWDKFVAAYAKVKDAYPSPSIFAILYYNSFKSLLAGLNAVKGDTSNNQKALRAALSTLKWNTPTGPLSMDKNRNAITSTFIYQVVSDGKGGLTTKNIKRFDNVAQGTKVYGRVNSCADVK